MRSPSMVQLLGLGAAGLLLALLQALDRRAAARGNTRCRLTNIETARAFHLANGYTETGSPAGALGTDAG